MVLEVGTNLPTTLGQEENRIRARRGDAIENPSQSPGVIGTKSSTFRLFRCMDCDDEFFGVMKRGEATQCLVSTRRIIPGVARRTLSRSTGVKPRPKRSHGRTE